MYDKKETTRRHYDEKRLRSPWAVKQRWYGSRSHRLETSPIDRNAQGNCVETFPARQEAYLVCDVAVRDENTYSTIAQLRGGGGVVAHTSEKKVLRQASRKHCAQKTLVNVYRSCCERTTPSFLNVSAACQARFGR